MQNISKEALEYQKALNNTYSHFIDMVIEQDKSEREKNRYISKEITKRSNIGLFYEFFALFVLALGFGATIALHQIHSPLWVFAVAVTALQYVNVVKGGK
jgi:hypothetical protein